MTIFIGIINQSLKILDSYPAISNKQINKLSIIFDNINGISGSEEVIVSRCQDQSLADRVHACMDATMTRGSRITSQWSITWIESIAHDHFFPNQELRWLTRSQPDGATSVTSSVVFQNGFEECIIPIPLPPLF